MNPIVCLRGAEKAYGETVAVRAMDLSVESGEFLTLLGPSGCGKTTTLRMISGFETPDRGVVEIAGRDVTRVPPFRRNVNTVFQSYALFPHMSVYDNVAYGLVVKRRPRAEIRRKVGGMLDRVGLNDKADSMPTELSGGQMQRVALARALVNEPAVLLLDEPLGALDAKLRRQMQIELKQMQRLLGTTFVYVTHDQEEAMTMSDRIVVMEGGLTQQIGPPSAIYSAPANWFVAGFLGDANFLPARVESSGNGAAAVRLTGGNLIRCRGADTIATGQSVLLFARPEHVFATLSPGSAAPTGEDTLVGRLIETIHRGPLRRARFDLGHGIHVDADSLSATAEPEADAGSVWHLHIPAERAIAFPEPTAAAGSGARGQRP